MGKNKTIPGGERTIILKVLHFFEEEKKKGSLLLPLKNALSRTSTATGVSISTITRIKKEEFKILQEMSSSTAPEAGSEQTTSSALTNPKPEVILPTPGKTRRSAYNKLDINDFTVCALKNIVDNFYKEKNELPTLRKILAVAKADFNFPGHRETLRKILREKCGYTFEKCVKKKSNLLRGGNEIGFWRARNSKCKEKKFADKKQKKIKNEPNQMKQIGNDLSETQNDNVNMTTQCNLHEISIEYDEPNPMKNELIEIKILPNKLGQVEFREIKNEHSDVKIEEMQSVGSEASMLQY